MSWKNSSQEMNLKSAILAMVDRLNEGVKRLELASDISSSGLAGDEMRMELANVAQVGLGRLGDPLGHGMEMNGNLMGFPWFSLKVKMVKIRFPDRCWLIGVVCS